ncbi:DUF5133 domain-containing protein [Streptomyces olivochromogenes]|uniref:DUF5133 domain-containing protein n=1 Tax=Streptomyces olivochromogenes TaxID=1963 RepID=UPI001F1D5FE8|nr:DUF5133 domain-containing protein [Streptomyces olivochromogenes]MCF3134153.1 DUF5133 domain-containing protein [Streptomyces olivochromogenes]
MLTAYPPLSGGGPLIARQLEDATYTLCVLTGTRQLDTTLFVARRQLADAMTQNGSPPR